MQYNQMVTCKCGENVEKTSKAIVDHCIDKQHLFVRQLTKGEKK